MNLILFTYCVHNLCIRNSQLIYLPKKKEKKLSNSHFYTFFTTNISWVKIFVKHYQKIYNVNCMFTHHNLMIKDVHFSIYMIKSFVIYYNKFMLHVIRNQTIKVNIRNIYHFSMTNYLTWARAILKLLHQPIFFLSFVFNLGFGN